MPVRSYHTRRGKPRVESQQENAIISPRLNRNLPQHKRSKLGQLTRHNNNSNNNNTPNQNDISEEELNSKMWKHMEVTTSNPLSAPVRSSSFATRYPEHRESYIRMSFKKMKNFLHKHGIIIEAKYSECSLIVSTTSRTWDPYSIIKSRDMIRLISRYVPFEHALKVMTDNVFSDIIEIGKTNVARNQVRFIKRRSRLIGPNGVTLKAIELLTKCYILVYGRTVCVIGNYKGIQTVRKIVMDCMNNIHPIYQLKRLMVEQELSTNHKLNNVSWDRFLPNFKKMKRNNNNNTFGGGGSGNNKMRNGLTINQIKKLSNKKKRKKQKYTPWPPAPTKSKIDIALENGAYWNKEWRKNNLKKLSAEQKFMKSKMEQQRQQLNKQEIFKKKQKTYKKIKNEMRFIAPSEGNVNVIKKRLKIGNNKDKGNYINAKSFTQNLSRFSGGKKGKNNQQSVKNFLIN